MIKKLSAFLLLIIFFVSSVPETSRAGWLVANLGSLTTWTKNSQQRKMFFDTTNNEWWPCYQKSASTTNLYCAWTSSIPPTFTEISPVALQASAVQNGGNFDFEYQGSSNAFLMSYYSTIAGEEARFMRGALSASSISWSSNTNYVDIATGTPSAQGDYSFGVTITTGGKGVTLFPNGSGGNLKEEISTTNFSGSYNSSSGDWPSISIPGTAQYTVLSQVFHLAGTSDLITFATAQNVGGSVRYLQYSTYLSGTPNAWVDFIGTNSTMDVKNWGSVQVSVTNTCMLAISDTSGPTFVFFCFDGSTMNSKNIPPALTNGMATNAGITLSTNGTNILARTIRGDGSKTLTQCLYTVASNSWCGAWSDIEATISGNYVSAPSRADTSGNMPVLYQISNGDLIMACTTFSGSACSLAGGGGGGVPSPTQNPVIFFDGDDLD
jgi:hypothetical protein